MSGTGALKRAATETAGRPVLIQAGSSPVRHTGREALTRPALDAAMTDPEQAAEFTAATGVDALAVAVGNGHGFTSEPVRLDLDRLAAIHRAVPVPLVPYGASGLPEEEPRRASSASSPPAS